MCSHFLLCQRTTCFRPVGCTGSPSGNSNPSKCPRWTSSDWRWEPREQRTRHTLATHHQLRRMMMPLLMCSYLMSPSLQSRQHSVQYEKFPRALHQLFINLQRFERHTGGKHLRKRVTTHISEGGKLSRWPWTAAWRGPGGTPQGRGGCNISSAAWEYSAASCWFEHLAGSGPAVLKGSWGPQERRFAWREERTFSPTPQKTPTDESVQCLPLLMLLTDVFQVLLQVTRCVFIRLFIAHHFSVASFGPAARCQISRSLLLNKR